MFVFHVFMWLFGCQDVPSFVGILCSFVRECVYVALWLSHLSAASCQDAPSLGRESHSVFIRA